MRNIHQIDGISIWKYACETADEEVTRTAPWSSFKFKQAIACLVVVGEKALKALRRAKLIKSITRLVLLLELREFPESDPDTLRFIFGQRLTPPLSPDA